MIKPYIIISNLIIQPTWGGKYIAEFKSLGYAALLSQNIGQSYELYELSRLSSKTSTASDPTIEIGISSDPSDAKMYGDDQPITIQKLIDKDPVGVLGGKAVRVYGEKMGVLIKFTQAKGNSYQLHVMQKGEGKWQSKPESWYYFEPGIITLGIKNKVDWDEYKKVCMEIDKTAKELSSQVKDGSKSLERAREELGKLISSLRPDQFVNTLETTKNQGIDLSACGMHHSWEESQKFPRGNIVYEVQKNVYDPVSTIRCFDKGNIKDDGSIRQLQIEDYFKYIDRSEEANNPANYNKPPEIIEEESSHLVKKVFDSQHYQMDEIELKAKISNNHTKTSNSFHHLFVREGEIQIKSNSGTLTLTKGYSAFIPANTGQYSITPSKKAVILKTYV